MTDDPMIAIRKHFTVETAPRKKEMWLVSCEKCGDQWHLHKTGAIAVGNVLHLLNHARSHDKEET